MDVLTISEFADMHSSMLMLEFADQHLSEFADMHSSMLMFSEFADIHSSMLMF